MILLVVKLSNRVDLVPSISWMAREVVHTEFYSTATGPAANLAIHWTTVTVTHTCFTIVRACFASKPGASVRSAALLRASRTCLGAYRISTPATNYAIFGACGAVTLTCLLEIWANVTTIASMRYYGTRSGLHASSAGSRTASPSGECGCAAMYWARAKVASPCFPRMWA